MSSRQQQFLEVYRQARVEDQRGYYEHSAAKSEAAHRQLLLASAMLFGASGAVALLAGIEVPGKLVWAIFAAVLPAITTALSAYDGLYAFERVTKLYRDAARNLRRVQPPGIAVDEQTAVMRYVSEVERILDKERGQWGQLAAEAQAERERG
jgi:hypothetical protein